MAALQQSVGGLQSSDCSHPQQSFVGALTKSVSIPASIPDHFFIPATGLHKGFPAATFTQDQLQAISKPFNWTLIGKFSHGFNKQNPDQGRPSVEKLREYFVSLDLKGAYSIGLLDNRHLLIQLQSEEDYLRFYSRMVWYVGPITMRIFKWTPNFHVDTESSVVPVWIAMPRLPIQFFDKRSLFPIASLIGRPLRLDAATLTLKRPSVARVQIELDLLKPRPRQIWIGMGEKDGYWQRVDYENVPLYCSHCKHVGHAETHCRIKNPELQNQLKEKTKQTKHSVSFVHNDASDPMMTESLPVFHQPKTTSDEPGLVNAPASDDVTQLHNKSQKTDGISGPVQIVLEVDASQSLKGSSGPGNKEKSAAAAMGNSFGHEIPVSAALRTVLSSIDSLEDELPRVQAHPAVIDVDTSPEALKSLNSLEYGVTTQPNRQNAMPEVLDALPEVNNSDERPEVNHSVILMENTTDLQNKNLELNSVGKPVVADCSMATNASCASEEKSCLSPARQNVKAGNASQTAMVPSETLTRGELVVLLPQPLPADAAMCPSTDQTLNANANAPAVTIEQQQQVAHGPSTSLITPTMLYTTPTYIQKSNEQQWQHNQSLHMGFLPLVAQNSLNFQGSDEAISEEDSAEEDEQDFLDQEFIRDDIYLQQRQNRRVRDSLDVQFRRGRGRPPGSRGRSYFDVVRTINTRSKSID